MSKTTPESYRVRIFTHVLLGTREGLEQLLDLLGAAGLAPTHTGRDERAKEPFDREKLVLEVTESPQGRAFALVRRRKAPTYTASLRAQKQGLTSVALELGSTPDARLPYSLGEQLAEAFRIEHGLVHPKYADRGDFNAAGVMELQWLQDFGPGEPAARTWYGPHMTKLIGVERLKQAGGQLVETAWGGVQLDLVAEPWAADLETLARRQREVAAALGPSGVLGDYTHPVKYKRGANWSPIPT